VLEFGIKEEKMLSTRPASLEIPRLPAARFFGLKTSFLSVINKRRRDKAEHNPCGAVDRPRSAKGALIF